VVAFCADEYYSVGTVHEIHRGAVQRKPVLLISLSVKYDSFLKLAACRSA